MPGGYKDAFEMRPARTSSVIATEQLGKQKAEDARGAQRYPYFTCELGGGMTSAYHRRLNMEPLDAFAIGVVKLGSGSNLPGYYIFKVLPWGLDTKGRIFIDLPVTSESPDAGLR